jgi:Glycosyl transferase family 2
MTKDIVYVDVIIPVHNSANTLAETVTSAMSQVIPQDIVLDYSISISVCCYDDGSTDNSLEILTGLQPEFADTLQPKDGSDIPIPSRLLVAQSQNGLARGAGFARNRAAELSENQRSKKSCREQFLCMLDSDDIMISTRVYEQTNAMMSLPKEERQQTLLGCKVKRDPPDSTWHYTQWANGLTDERLMLEKFRECTLLQSTWFLTRSRFQQLGGYIEAPQSNGEGQRDTKVAPSSILRLIHPTFDTLQTLRLAEDLRLFHAHLHSDGLLRLHRPTQDPDMPLVIYRHNNQSQSFRTSRKLLLHLRALAFEKCVLTSDYHYDRPGVWSKDCHGGKFVVWGAGRDGKDFVKALSADAQKRVFCFVDVDSQKIGQGYYANQEMKLKIPIVHFSLLAKSAELRTKLLDSSTFAKIDKSKPEANEQPPQSKKQKTDSIVTVTASHTVSRNVDLSILPELPVVVCVAMYRTNGALEANVASIGRDEGKDLWHFS